MGECIFIRRREISVPDGMTVTPLNSVETWVRCAGLGYGSLGSPTLAQVVANSTICAALMNSQNAVNYMIRSTTIQTSVLGSTTAVAALDASTPWKSTSYNGGGTGDGPAGWWIMHNYPSEYFHYDLGQQVWIYKTRMEQNHTYGMLGGTQFLIKASANGTTWTQIATFPFAAVDTDIYDRYVKSPASATLFRYMRTYTNMVYTGDWGSMYIGLQFYGKKLEAVT